MKKVFAIIATLALAATVCAARPTGFNIGAGYSAEFFKYTGGFGGLSDTDNNMYGGAFVEAGYDFSFSDLLGLYAGARFNLGFNFDAAGNDNLTIFNIKEISNLTIPVMFAVSVPAGKSSIFFNVGPSFDFWLSSKGFIGGETSSASSSRVINYFDGDDSTRRVNILLGGKVGVNIINHIKVYAAYDHTMLNMLKDGDKYKEYGASAKASMGQLRIGAAYVF